MTTERPTLDTQPIPAARHAANQGHHRAPRTAGARRLPRAARVMLVVALAIGIYIAGGVIIGKLIADDALWVFSMLCWGFMVAGTAQALIETGWRR